MTEPTKTAATAIRRLSDTETAAAEANASTPKTHAFTTDELAAHDKEVAAGALREAARAFGKDVWVTLIRPAVGMPGLSRNANSVMGWLADRADGIERSSGSKE